MTRTAAVTTFHWAPGTETTLPPATSVRPAHHGVGVEPQQLRAARTSHPARSWNSVRVKPGQSAVAVTPVPASSLASPSVKTVTKDFSAE